MLSLSLTLSRCSLHLSTRAPLRSRGRFAIVPTVDGATVRGCGLLLEVRNLRTPSGDYRSLDTDLGALVPASLVNASLLCWVVSSAIACL